MKTEIFLYAIKNRFEIRFLYQMEEFFVEPYYVSSDDKGNKSLFGRIRGTNSVKKFDYRFISNIRVFNNRKFCPIIPIIPLAS
ncbi:MAG: hypothetical protein NZM09_08715 [Ignavibacterium sp.]|nr:hypothetical protein [Ignavibacterium sp.]MCX7610843.1 hypothetical protein [Ignavibacterium sp.]MDW8375765.1 hypothetical protein [Ignavibacteriales bacterium]